MNAILYEYVTKVAYVNWVPDDPDMKSYSIYVLKQDKQSWHKIRDIFTDSNYAFTVTVGDDLNGEHALNFCNDLTLYYFGLDITY